MDRSSDTPIVRISDSSKGNLRLVITRRQAGSLALLLLDLLLCSQDETELPEPDLSSPSLDLFDIPTPALPSFGIVN